MINVKKDSHNLYVGVSKPRLSVLGCLLQYNLNETSDYVVFIFFSKFCASKSGVRLIYGCGLYTDVYGNLTASLPTDMPIYEDSEDLELEDLL